MSVRLDVVCSDRGQHGRRELGALLLDDDGHVREATVRKAAAPKLRGAVARLDGDSDEQYGLPPHVYVTAPSVRADFEGARRFSFSCSTCGRRRVTWNEATAQALVQQLSAAGVRVVDISLLP